MPNNSVLAKMAVQISANTAQFNAALAQTNQRLGIFQSTVINTGKSLLASFGTYQIFGALKRGVQTIAEFERQMGKLQAITGSTSSELESLRNNALSLGRTTEYTARQIGGLQVEFGRLGFSTAEILKSTEATIDLATATGEDLARSAEIAGSTLRAFQLNASEMGRVVDVMTGALNNSALTLDYFADAIKYVSPVAKATNVSIEETASILSVLADAGIKGSQAGTSTRRIFTELNKSGKPLNDRLKELAKSGITLAAANDEVGLYAQTALLVLANQTDRVDELTKKYEGLNGEAKRTAGIIRDDLQGDFDRLTSAIEGVTLKGTGLNDFFRNTTQAATDLVERIGDDVETLRVLFKLIDDNKAKLGIYDISKDPKLGAFNEIPQTLDEAIKKFNDLKPFEGTDQYNFLLSDIEKKAKDAGRQLILLKDESTGISKIFNKPSPVTFQTAAEKAKKDAEELVRQAEYDRIAREEAAKAVQLEEQALKKAIAAAVELQRIQIEANQENPLDFSNVTDSKFKTEHGFSDTIDKLLSEDTQQAIQDFGDTYDQTFNDIVDSTIEFLENQEKIKQSMLETRNAAASLGDSFGGFFGELAAGTLTAAQAASRAAADIISTIERITLARMIESQSRFGIPGIIAAAAGFGLVKSLFARIGRGSSGGSAGGSGGVAYTPSTSLPSLGGYSQSSLPSFTAETVIRGQDLYVVLNNYQNSKKNTHG